MDAVGLVERPVGGHPVEEEGVEDRPVALGKIGVDGVELRRIVAAEIARRHHAGKQHRQSPVIHQPGEKLVERIARDLRAYAAERIVGAELDDDAIGILAHRPVEACQPVARCVAGYAGIDDHHIVTAGAERRLELGRKGLLGRQPVAGGQAVAEGDDPHRLGGGRHGKRGRDGKDDRKRLDRQRVSPI